MGCRPAEKDVVPVVEPTVCGLGLRHSRYLRESGQDGQQAGHAERVVTS